MESQTELSETIDETYEDQPEVVDEGDVYYGDDEENKIELSEEQRRKFYSRGMMDASKRVKIL